MVLASLYVYTPAVVHIICAYTPACLQLETSSFSHPPQQVAPTLPFWHAHQDLCRQLRHLIQGCIWACLSSAASSARPASAPDTSPSISRTRAEPRHAPHTAAAAETILLLGTPSLAVLLRAPCCTAWWGLLRVRLWCCSLKCSHCRRWSRCRGM